VNGATANEPDPDNPADVIIVPDTKLEYSNTMCASGGGGGPGGAPGVRYRVL